MAVDPAGFRQTMARWATGVTVVTALHEGVRYGMTVNSFTSVSLNPTLVSFCVGKGNMSHPAMTGAGHFAVNILSVDQVELGMRFAGMIQVADRFEGLDLTTAETGAPILPGVVAWLDCRTVELKDAGDHTIIIGEVEAAWQTADRHPLLYSSRTWGQFEPLPRRSLVHVVMMRLKENTAENANRIMGELKALEDRIPQIRRLDVGHNVVPSDRAYDIGLTVVFDSLEDMQAYQVHPDHQYVLTEVIRPLISGSAAVDYYSEV